MPNSLGGPQFYLSKSKLITSKVRVRGPQPGPCPRRPITSLGRANPAWVVMVRVHDVLDTRPPDTRFPHGVKPYFGKVT